MGRKASLLGDRRIDELLAIKGFGPRCLVDLLTALEGVAARRAPRPRHTPPTARLLLQEALRLREEPAAASIGRGDPRLGGLVRALDPQADTARDLADRLLSLARELPQPDTARDGLRQLRARLRSLARQPLEDELQDLLASVAKPRNSRMIAHLWGWDGGGGCTLQAAGDRYGMTRERVRQIGDDLREAVQGQPPFVPALDRALALVAARVPGTAEALEAQLAGQGIVRHPFRLEGLCHAARRLGRPLPFAFVTVGGTRFALPLKARNLVQKVHEVARWTCLHRGAATFAGVASRLAAREGLTLTPSLVERMLRARPDFAWLNRRGGWFWLRVAGRNLWRRNVVLERMRKIVAVAGRIGVAELRAGVARGPIMKGAAPPAHVLAALARQALGSGPSRHMVTARPPLKWRKVLPRPERIMVRVLRQYGPALPRPEFLRHCLAFGMVVDTFSAYLEHSPVLTRLARGVFGLRGVPLAPAAVASLARPPRPRWTCVDHGRMADGRLWLAYRVSQAMLKHGDFTPPPDAMRLIARGIDLRASNGAPAGRLGPFRDRAIGLKHFLKARRARMGNYLLIVLDGPGRQAVASAGSARLLWEFKRRHAKEPVRRRPHTARG